MCGACLCLLNTFAVERCVATELRRHVQAFLQAVPGLSWLSGHSRKITFRATNVEDACEWAIALREAIALAVSGR